MDSFKVFDKASHYNLTVFKLQFHGIDREPCHLVKNYLNSCNQRLFLKLQSNFIEITLQHGCSPVNLLYIFRTPFSKNTSGWLLLYTSNLDISEATIRGVFEIALQHGFSPVNLLHIFRTLFPKNTSGPLLLTFFLEK